jgi:hypothetical protein
MAGQQHNAQMAQKEQQAREARMPLGRRNYIMMLIGLGVILIGFVLMSGGGSDDPTVFNEKMFSFRRITLAPILVIAGFVIEISAIMHRPKETNAKTPQK